MNTVTFLSSVSPTGVSSSCGANTGPLVPIGTFEPDATSRRRRARRAAPGAVVTQIALTPSRLNLAAARGHVLVGRLDLLLDDLEAVLLGGVLDADQAALAVVALEVEVADRVALLEALVLHQPLDAVDGLDVVGRADDRDAPWRRAASAATRRRRASMLSFSKRRQQRGDDRRADDLARSPRRRARCRGTARPPSGRRRRRPC